MVIKFIEHPPPNSGSTPSTPPSAPPAVPFPVEGHQSFAYTFYINYERNDDGEEQQELSLYYSPDGISTPFICTFGGANNASFSAHYYEELYMYNIESGVWHIQPTFGDRPHGRVFHSVAAFPDLHRIYLFGGKSRWSCDNQLYYLDLTNWMWVLVHCNQKVVPCGRYHHSMVRVDNSIYMFGGLSSMGFVLQDFWIFDTRVQLWKEIKLAAATIPSARYGHVMQAVNNRIYIFGGTTKGSALCSDIWLYHVNASQFKRIDHLLGQGSALVFSQDNDDSQVVAAADIVVYDEEKTEQLKKCISGKSMASCIIGNKIMIAGGEVMKPKSVFSDFILFDTDSFAMEVLQWELPNANTKRFSLSYAGCRLFVIGGKHLPVTNSPNSSGSSSNSLFHFFTEVSIPGQFPLRENSLQLLSDILINTDDEYDHMKAVIALGELVEVQMGVESIIDTSASLQSAIIKLLKKGDLVDVQSILQTLLNYFEIDNRRCLFEEIAYQVLESAEENIDACMTQSDVSYERDFYLRLSIIRQFMKLFQSISIRYDKYNSFILLTKIQSVLCKVLEISHNMTQFQQRDGASVYQIIVHIQTVVAQTFSQLVNLNNFISDCDIDRIETTISKFIENTNYVNNNATTDSIDDGSSNNLLRQHDLDVMKMREQLTSNYDLLQRRRTEAKETDIKPEAEYVKPAQVFYSPRVGRSIGLLHYKSITKEMWHKMQDFSINQVLQRDEFLTCFQEYVQVFRDQDMNLLLLWCELMNLKFVIDESEMDDTDQIFDLLQDIKDTFFEPDSENFLDEAESSGLIKYEVHIDQFMHDLNDNVQVKSNQFDPMIASVEKCLETAYNEWIEGEVFEQQQKEFLRHAIASSPATP